MKKVLITGATGKLGQIMTNYFLKHGNIVIATGRDKRKLKEMQNADNEKLKLIETNHLEDNATKILIKKLNDEDLMPDWLVNNARDRGTLEINKDGMISCDNFMKEYKMNVYVPYELTTHINKAENTKLKAVVNIGSQYGLVAPNLKLYDNPEEESFIHYGVTKAALSHLTKELAVRLAKQNIRVNCIAFGGIEGRENNDFLNRYKNLTPMERMVKEDEVAAPVEMLLSEKSSAITGITLSVDCGWSLW